MAAAAKENTPITGEYVKPDAGLAFRIKEQEIDPKLEKMAAYRGETKEPWTRIKEQARFPKFVLTFVTKLFEMEEAERDHNILALHEAFKLKDIKFRPDLVAMAQGQEAGTSVIPMGERPKPKLAFQMDRKVQHDVEDNSDLADAGDVVIPMSAETIADEIAETNPALADELVADEGSSIAGMEAPEASPDDGMMTVSVKGVERRVHYSSKVQPKGMTEGQIWRDEKSETFWVMTTNGLRSYAFAEDAE